MMCLFFLLLKIGIHKETLMGVFIRILTSIFSNAWLNNDIQCNST